MQNLNSRLYKHGQLIDYYDKLADLETLIPLFSNVLYSNAFNPDTVNKDAVVTYMQNGIHWAKRRNKANKSDSAEDKVIRARRRDAFEVHCKTILETIPPTREWIEAMNKPDKWDNRILLQECVIQRKFGNLLIPILIGKFKANLFHKGNLIMHLDRKTEETQENVFYMLFDNYFSTQHKEDYNEERVRLFITTIQSKRRDIKFHDIQILMNAKNANKQSVYTLLEKHVEEIENHQEVKELLSSVCTKEKYFKLFH